MRQSATKQRTNSQPRRPGKPALSSSRKKNTRQPSTPSSVKKLCAKREPLSKAVLLPGLLLPHSSAQPKFEGMWMERLPIEEPACVSLGAPTMPWTGSRRLLLGVLQDALRSFFQYRSNPTRQGQRIFDETQAWIWSSEQNWLYSFENICAHLRLDPGYIRQGLQHFLQTTRPAAATPRRSTRPSHRRAFRLISGPGTRIPRRTHDSGRLVNIN